ncbi:hydroxyacylglutathione hydrolase [Francisella tularensis subsp. novicida]|uniref:hydroxyacylglutathione hydrolase n=1 Tax=Francisella tularensis TaxID=263 RepID=UPI000158B08D|nr:hydroxyacylglutathione hydrolase [Francisella tularensis]AJI45322.1 metallo-beta-lactamase superfamily protein [Francisella tularensis subsp. novicida F6168]AJJ46605.1 metallo-beta-lactamase superfamily protein [Francisella tularensis subsp. novicida]APC98814.1 metallo-beta-lactamase superfamily protein [Francisella tularensis subsp. novicida]EDN36679.1 hydroxyacylglutathione hydrolase [Francisella tularensis subsp. novicida GA99-3549]KFJ66682.1 metallo-beta-lactamase superfamily protein [F
MQIKRWFLNNSLRNYQYLLYDKSHAIVIDPLKSDIFAEFIAKNKLQLEAILITHKHGDHIAGVKKLLAIYPNAKVYAYTENDLFKPDIYVKDGSFINLGFTSFRVMYTPGHIDDHVCFLFEQERALFCGDTLFNAGVGGVQAESADINQLYDSLVKITKLDGDIRPYPAHDYWLGNLDFALSILADDSYFNYYRNQVAELAAEDKPIVNLAEEAKLNIFIRAMSDKALLKALPDYSLGREMFVKLRQLKNNF